MSISGVGKQLADNYMSSCYQHVLFVTVSAQVESAKCGGSDVKSI